ncbi:MAG: hypothetical protein JXA11_16820 [Phycisphaerae bacterium]|nr:hypothetical protein [Phycisphaerae bacterium]
MKCWLFVLVGLAVFLNGCADMDMSGFGDIGVTMHDRTPLRPASPPPDSPSAQLARNPEQSCSSTP